MDDLVGLCKSSSLFEVLDGYFLGIDMSWVFENQQLAASSWGFILSPYYSLYIAVYVHKPCLRW